MSGALRKIVSRFFTTKTCSTREEETTIMDTRKLVVGQEVYMFCESEVYGFEKGKVVKITSAGVDVLVGESIICFGYDGTELEVERRKRHDRFLQSSQSQSLALPAFHPWYLDYMPFEERTAKIISCSGKPRSLVS